MEVPDMMLIAGNNQEGQLEIRALEYDPEAPKKWDVPQSKVSLVRTNVAMGLTDNQPRRDEDLDSYLRFENASSLLATVNDIDSMMDLLKDHKNGPSQNSICRHEDPATGNAHNGNGKHNTVATGIMTYDLATGRVEFHYQMDGRPCTAEYRKIVLKQ